MILKTDKNIFVAFILNLTFSIFELLGGLFTGSIAILTDSIHDFGDAISIGVSYFLEKKSKKKPNNKYTYGYLRYSVFGSIITTTILFVGSVLVIFESIKRILNPVEINYNGMLILAIIGVIVNIIATYTTKEGESLNQKAVNLHMLEDVLGWVVVLVGAIVMNFTDIKIIDPCMSIGVAVLILVTSLRNLKLVVDIFLAKTPSDVDIDELKEHLIAIDGVEDIHHIHVWSIDGYNNYATMHIVSKSEDIAKVKKDIREELEEHNICHAILETETEACDDKECHVELKEHEHGHHHHH